MKAIVIGGSIAGLFAALYLRRHGVEVDVYERVEAELAGRGAGIATHPQILERLAALELAAADFGVTTTMRRAFGVDGRVVAQSSHRQVMTSWDRLFALLRTAFPADRYHRGRELARIEPRGDEVVAYFAGGEAVAADVLIGADGFRSTVRATLFPETAMAYAGYVAWRALVAEADLAPPLHRQLFDALAFCLPEGEQILGYPVAGTANDLRDGHRRYNIVWYRPADQAALQRLLTDDDGRIHDISIPPPLISRAAIDQLRRDADERLAPQFRDVMRLADRPFLQPIYDIESARLARGRVAIIGDAAFLARPHVGAGVAKAADDASALAEALAAERDVVRALAAFEARRLGVGHRIVARARHLGAYMQARRDSAEEQAMAARYRSPEAVLRDTATLDFLAEERDG